MFLLITISSLKMLLMQIISAGFLYVYVEKIRQNIHLTLWL